MKNKLRIGKGEIFHRLKMTATEQKYDKQFAVVFDAIREMMNPPQGKKQPVGFVHRKGEDDARRKA